MTPKILTISLLLLTSCHKNDQPPQTPISKDSQPTTTSGSQPTTIATPPIETVKTAPLPVADLPKHVGKTVMIQGKISDIPWQHMMAPPAGTKHDYYFNIGERQIVLYTKEELVCGTTLEVTGTVLEVAGASKRGGPAMFKEYHLDVASWKCIP
jgi:hypothetical protein